MNVLDFEELVAKAVSLLDGARKAEGVDTFADDVMNARIFKKLTANLCLANESKSYIATLDGIVEVDKTEHLRCYFDSDCDDPQMFDALIRRVADELEAGVCLHPVAAHWIASVLRGQLKRPSKRGRPAALWRNIHIGLTIEAIAEFTDHAGRNPDSPAVSAIDVVQEALGRSGMASLGFEQLKDIWEAFQRDRILIELPDP